MICIDDDVLVKTIKLWDELSRGGNRNGNWKKLMIKTIRKEVCEQKQAKLDTLEKMIDMIETVKMMKQMELM